MVSTGPTSHPPNKNYLIGHYKESLNRKCEEQNDSHWLGKGRGGDSANHTSHLTSRPAREGRFVLHTSFRGHSWSTPFCTFPIHFNLEWACCIVIYLKRLLTIFRCLMRPVPVVFLLWALTDQLTGKFKKILLVDKHTKLWQWNTWNTTMHLQWRSLAAG